VDPISDHGAHGPGGSHRQPGIEDELVADDLDLTAERHDIATAGAVTPDELLERSDLAVVLLPSVFPASAVAIAETAREQGAPSELLDRLGRLPPATYHTVQEVWAALGGATETRQAAAASEAPRPAPAVSAATEPVPAVPPWVDAVARAAGGATEVTVRLTLGATVAIVTGVARRVAHRTPGRPPIA